MADLANVPPRVQARFWSRVEINGPDDCWPWRLSIGTHGYGQFGWSERGTGSRGVLSHRLAYALTRSLPISGHQRHALTVDHRCHNRVCCNPAHLRVKGNVANATDNGMATRTVCPAGHRYDSTNTYVNKKGHRICRACAVAGRRRAVMA